MDGFDFWAVAGTVSASLCWKTDPPDAGRMMAGTPYALCSICLERRYASGRPGSDGDRPYRSEQKFFRAGESTRAEGRFYSESPLSLAFFAVWKAEKICLSVDFAHLSLSIKIIALATICNIMKY